MTYEDRDKINDQAHSSLNTRISDVENRITAVEKRLAEKDTQFAVINTKLSAILWCVGAIGTALIGVLIKVIFRV